MRRRLFVPEVVQTSAMDCGPASLKCLLEGFGIPVSYGRLREACQTDVDGTSIDTMEEVAIQLGLDAEQVVLPADHVLVAEGQNLPAIVVIKTPSGVPHFVVAWHSLAGVVEVMDPATGRRWPSARDFLAELYLHTQKVSAAGWRDWAGADEKFLGVLRRRLADLGVPRSASVELVARALTDPTWRGLAALDAATRATRAILDAKGLRKGPEAKAVLDRFVARAQGDLGGDGQSIPTAYFSVRPAKDDPSAPEEQLLFRGAVLVRAYGRKSALPTQDEASSLPLSADLAEALRENPTHPARELWGLLRGEGLLAPLILTLALSLAAASVLFEALLFRGLLDVGHKLALGSQRFLFILGVLAFAGILLLIEFPIAAGFLRLGRRIESRLRMTLLQRIPHLGDRYFHSRLTSDMAERSHSLHALRLLPSLGEDFLRTVFELLLTTVGIVWIDPESAPIAIPGVLLLLGACLSTQPLLLEREMRVRSHTGALSRFYLDALLGLIPIRAHGAERTVKRQHEHLLLEWAKASKDLLHTLLATAAAQALLGMGLAVWLLFSHFSAEGNAGSALLLVYWVLSVPVLGQRLALVVQQYPLHRNIALRILEPLKAPLETELACGPRKADDAKDKARGLHITLDEVSVRAGGHSILEDIGLDIPAGSHVAIVGPSGAGKSSLVGLLLGWHRAAQGRVLVDGQPLDGQGLEALRRETAWLDPQVQLWNASLLDNLRYGAPSELPLSLTRAIETAHLHGVLQKLPAGLSTSLGEGGALVSGGEGQRVRFGRALLRPHVRLAILDEPFRGLDRETRRELLGRARTRWQEATLLCITHDVGETQTFPRVVVVENGRILEDDAPAALLARDSRYRALLLAEDEVRRSRWSSSVFRRLRMTAGILTETEERAE
jgi:ATP-binding cassette subfamily B protein